MDCLDQAKKQAERDSTMSAAEMRRTLERITAALVSDPNTLLYEQGCEDILADAFKDGSSVVCTACDALVPRDRFEQHRVYWCEKADNAEVEDL